MSEHSAIEWTDATWNCLAGCTRVSEGCDNCYAAQFAATRGKYTPSYKGLAVVTPSGRAAFNGKVRYIPHKLTEPLRWQKGRRIFVNSMSDVFHESLPWETIDRIFAVMALAPRHTFQVLTKRPDRMAVYCAMLTAERLADTASHDAEGKLPIREGGRSLWHIAGVARRRFTLPLANVWLGTSAENQAAWDERVEQLGRVPAAVRFVSAEPLLGPIDCGNAFDPPVDGDAYGPIHWVIVGGESGPRRRPMELDWLKRIATHCVLAGVPIFVKQDSAATPGAQGRIPEHLWALKQLPSDVERAQ